MSFYLWSPNICLFLDWLPFIKKVNKNESKFQFSSFQNKQSLSLSLRSWHDIQLYLSFLFDHIFFTQVIFILVWINNLRFLVVAVLDCSGAFNYTRLDSNLSNTGYVWRQNKKPNMSHRNHPSTWTKIHQSKRHQLPHLSYLSDHLPTNFLLADNSRSRFGNCCSSSILKLLWAELSPCKSCLPVLLWPLSSVRHCERTNFSDNECGKIPQGT